MNDERLALHQSLLDIFPEEFTLYFRPPEKITLQYPCIVYDVKKHRALRANSQLYALGTTFKVSILSRIPGYMNARDVLVIPNSSHVSSFTHMDIVNDIFDVNVSII